MKILNINKEWNFIEKEIVSSNKDKQNGYMLFAFQTLLSILAKSKNPIERLILISAYQKQKKQYFKI